VDSDSLFKAREDILGVLCVECVFFLLSSFLSLFFFLFVDMLKGFLGRVNNVRLKRVRFSVGI
jgi:hypothetical protein